MIMNDMDMYFRAKDQAEIKELKRLLKNALSSRRTYKDKLDALTHTRKRKTLIAEDIKSGFDFNLIANKYFVERATVASYALQIKKGIL